MAVRQDEILNHLPSIFLSYHGDDMDTKICTMCHDELPATSEYFNTKGTGIEKLDARCKICKQVIYYRDVVKIRKRQKINYLKNKDKIADKNKERYTANRERLLEQKREYCKNNKAKRRIYKMGFDFGISEDTYINLMNNQRGCCKICGDSLVFPDSKRGPSIDHNHTTGIVRGLLCNHCNTAIGLLRESEDIIKSALEYIRTNNG